MYCRYETGDISQKFKFYMKQVRKHVREFLKKFYKKCFEII